MTIAGTPLQFNLERTFMPLNALVESFTSEAREEAPGGKLVKALGDWGPSVWAPYIWAYAALLERNGYPEAAQELVGYLIPQTEASTSRAGASCSLRKAPSISRCMTLPARR